MRPPLSGTAGDKTSSWTLHSVIVSKDQNVAVINQRVVQVGDEVGGARVVSIYPDRVKLSSAGKSFFIKLQTLSVKRPVRGQ